MVTKLSEGLARLEQMNAGVLGLDNASPSPSFEIMLSQNPSAATAGAKLLPLNQIIVADRIRQHLDSEKIESLARSIRDYGFRGVLWVRLIDGQYHLVAGGRRYAACQLVGVTEVPVEVWEITDAEAIQLELLENFQREDLNPIEEVEGILRLLEVTLELQRHDVIALLNRKAREGRNGASKSADNVVRGSKKISDGAISPVSMDEDLYQQVATIFQVIGRYSPESFRTHRLPLLNLPEALISLVSNGELDYTKARVIGRIKNAELREQVLAQAIEENLSYAEVCERVKQAQAELAEDKPQTEDQVFRSRADRLMKRLKSASLEGRSRKKAEKLMSQLEELLGEPS